MTVHLLGTGAATSDPHRTTTMLAFEEGETSFLVDCGGDAVQRLLMAGLDPATLDAVILTHEHPDHISGFALLIEKLWLLGRRTPIPIYGPAPTLELARAIFNLYDTNQWDGLPDRTWHAVEMTTGAPVFERGPFRVSAAPVDHPVPTIGLRIETASSTVAYSCDTSPCQAVIELARDADLLIHEGTGALPGVHSSPEEAAEAAAEANANRLLLVHIPVGVTDEDLHEARAIFPRTEWGEEGGTYSA
ncbi:MAG: ribonuclease Z [Bacteroidota bacterium]